MRLVVTVVLDVAPVEYGQARGHATVGVAEAHAEHTVPAELLAAARQLGTGITAQVTEVLVNPR